MLSILKTKGELVSTRNGPAIMLPEPMMLTLTRPTERVLFNIDRDPNPYFHLFEALWMLAGRNDVRSVEYYNKRMASFSDDGFRFHGAYGYRWRSHFGKDQLLKVAKLLQEDPDTRRAVLAMWDPTVDLGYIHGKDLPCNTHIYFSVLDNKLNMSVCNRSNDLLWGLLGANAVHMSVLLETMAALTGCEVGRYTTFTNNLHVYTEFGPWTKLMNPEVEARNLYSCGPEAETRNLYAYGPTAPKLVDDPHTWLSEVRGFVSDPKPMGYNNYWLDLVANPIVASWEERKQGGTGLGPLEDCEDTYWTLACRDYIHNRRDK